MRRRANAPGGAVGQGAPEPATVALPGAADTSRANPQAAPVAAPDLAVVCDFDGTIAEQDVCLSLLETFAGDGWRQLEADYEQGRIDLPTCLVGQVATFAAPLDTLVAWARQNARLRAGFPEFVAFCRQQSLPLLVVSAGLDFYIQAILEREGLQDLDVTCIATEAPAGRVQVRLPLAGYADLGSLSDFKEVVVHQQQQQGRRVVFVGDGSTDFNAARSADLVFARDKLLAHCRREGIPCTPFDTFADVQAPLAALRTLGR